MTKLEKGMNGAFISKSSTAKKFKEYSPSAEKLMFEKPVREATVARAMIKRYFHDMYEYAESDVVIVGAGSCGLSCAYYLATRNPNLKIAIIEVTVRSSGKCLEMFNESEYRQM